MYYIPSNYIMIFEGAFLMDKEYQDVSFEWIKEEEYLLR